MAPVQMLCMAARCKEAVTLSYQTQADTGAIANTGAQKQDGETEIFM